MSPFSEKSFQECFFLALWGTIFPMMNGAHLWLAVKTNRILNPLKFASSAVRRGPNLPLQHKRSPPQSAVFLSSGWHGLQTTQYPLKQHHSLVDCLWETAAVSFSIMPRFHKTSMWWTCYSLNSFLVISTEYRLIWEGIWDLINLNFLLQYMYQVERL